MGGKANATFTLFISNYHRTFIALNNPKRCISQARLKGELSAQLTERFTVVAAYRYASLKQSQVNPSTTLRAVPLPSMGGKANATFTLFISNYHRTFIALNNPKRCISQAPIEGSWQRS